MKKITAAELLEYLRKRDIEVEIQGNKDTEIIGFSSLSHYKTGSITWIRDQIIAEQKDLKFTAVICPADTEAEAEVKMITANPRNTFFTAIEYLDDTEAAIPRIAETAVLGKNVQIGENVSIGEYCCVGDHVKIGKDTKIDAHVVIYENVKIGERCVVKSGAVIGGTGFGYSKRDRKYYKIRHRGGVVIGDDVDIGSNTCIDRGTLDDTVIEDGAKIDNLCHIAHNVRIGCHSCVVANSTICGSVQIGQGVYIAPNSVIMNQIEVEDGAIIGMGAGVVKHISQNTVNIGFPAKSIRTRTEEDWNI